MNHGESQYFLFFLPLLQVACWDRVHTQQSRVRGHVSIQSVQDLSQDQQVGTLGLSLNVEKITVWPLTGTNSSLERSSIWPPVFDQAWRWYIISIYLSPSLTYSRYHLLRKFKNIQSFIKFIINLNYHKITNYFRNHCPWCLQVLQNIIQFAGGKVENRRRKSTDQIREVKSDHQTPRPQSLWTLTLDYPHNCAPGELGWKYKLHYYHLRGRHPPDHRRAESQARSVHPGVCAEGGHESGDGLWAQPVSDHPQGLMHFRAFV